LAAASEVSLRAGGALVLALVLFLAYRRYADRVEDPIVELHHLLGPRLRAIHFTATLAVGAGTGAGAFLPVYLNGARGLSTGAAAFSVLSTVLGWTTASWVTSRLLDRYTVPTVIRSAALLFFGASSAAAVAAALDAPVPVLLVAFFFNGCGIGSITSSGLALLQSRAEAAEMGRVSAAHQFLRSLGFAYGAALAGLVLFTVIRLRIDDVETVRQLLGQSDDVPESAEAVAALRSGFIGAQTAMAVVAAGTLYTARQLRDEVGDLVPSKRASGAASATRSGEEPLDDSGPAPDSPLAESPFDET
jgi:MFS family permease